MSAVAVVAVAKEKDFRDMLQSFSEPQLIAEKQRLEVELHRFGPKRTPVTELLNQRLAILGRTLALQ